MKLSIIGGGGVRSMFLAKSIALRAGSLGIDELTLMDNDAEKLRLFGGMAKHVARMLAPGMRVSLTQEAVDAVRDADYVITSLRVGGDVMRMQDEHIAQEAGVLGQETTGAAGFSFAMRSIPALLGYCEAVRQHARPGAKVFNFTNPVGIVSQALRDAGYDFTYGICDAPSSMLGQIAKLYGAPPSSVSGEMFGLNHLSWFHQVLVDGKDVLPELLQSEAARAQTDMRFFGTDLLAFIGVIPNEYLYYYYYREKAVQNILTSGKTRGDVILEVNQRMWEELTMLDPESDFGKCLQVFSKWYGMREAQYMAHETGIRRDVTWSFDPYAPDDGGYAGVALNYIDILRSGKPGSMILTIPNEGAVSFLRDTDTVEVSCTISNDGCVPHRFEDVPPDREELVRRVKCYERIGAQAILQSSRKDAVSALMLHPLVNSYSLSTTLVDKYIQHNTGYSREWGK